MVDTGQKAEGFPMAWLSQIGDQATGYHLSVDQIPRRPTRAQKTCNLVADHVLTRKTNPATGAVPC